MKKRIASLLLSAALLVVCAGCQSTSASIPTDSAPASQPDAAPTVSPAPAARPASLLGDLPVLYDTSLVPAVPEFTVAEDFPTSSTPIFWNTGMMKPRPSCWKTVFWSSAVPSMNSIPATSPTVTSILPIL